jgi:hypothetical protein
MKAKVWHLLIVYFVCFPIVSFSNDGAYTMSGNNLIPINDKSISIKKEHLSIKKMYEPSGGFPDNYYEVNVYYEFFNPGPDKQLIVGFEARSPSGAVDQMPINKGHPYMSDFTVMMNGQVLDHDIAYVADSSYYNAGVVRSMSYDDFVGDISINQGMHSTFYYVYHFNAEFKQGMNRIQHSYRLVPSSDVFRKSTFEYVLTSIHSWGDGKVDDFTLVIDHGNFSSFGVASTFFSSTTGWYISGIGNMNNLDFNENAIVDDGDWLSVNMRSGVLVFNQTDFKPQGDLELVQLEYSMGDLNSDAYMPEADVETELSLVPFSPASDHSLNSPKNDFELRVLRNLPYARRGYIFKSPDLKAFYEKVEWYMPDPNYIPDANKLLPSEAAFLKRLKSGD